MQYCVIIFDCPPDYMERRRPMVADHHTYVERFVASGNVIFGGGLSGEPSQGMFLFRAENRGAAETFAKEHPYVTGGIVTWQVREWYSTSIAPILANQ